MPFSFTNPNEVHSWATHPAAELILVIQFILKLTFALQTRTFSHPSSTEWRVFCSLRNALHKHSCYSNRYTRFLIKEEPSSIPAQFLSFASCHSAGTSLLIASPEVLASEMIIVFLKPSSELSVESTLSQHYLSGV